MKKALSILVFAGSMLAWCVTSKLDTKPKGIYPNICRVTAKSTKDLHESLDSIYAQEIKRSIPDTTSSDTYVISLRDHEYAIDVLPQNIAEECFNKNITQTCQQLIDIFNDNVPHLKRDRKNTIVKNSMKSSWYRVWHDIQEIDIMDMWERESVHPDDIEEYNDFIESESLSYPDNFDKKQEAFKIQKWKWIRSNITILSHRHIPNKKKSYYGKKDRENSLLLQKNWNAISREYYSYWEKYEYYCPEKIFCYNNLSLHTKDNSPCEAIEEYNKLERSHVTMSKQQTNELVDAIDWFVNASNELEVEISKTCPIEAKYYYNGIVSSQRYKSRLLPNYIPNFIDPTWCETSENCLDLTVSNPPELNIHIESTCGSSNFPYTISSISWTIVHTWKITWTNYTLQSIMSWQTPWTYIMTIENNWSITSETFVWSK